MLDYELCLIRTFSVTKFFKSWLIFYRYGLCDEFVRDKLKNNEGDCPWKSDTSGKWNYLRNHEIEQDGEFSGIVEGENELFCMFEFWRRKTLWADEFEVFNISDMGLGVRVLEQACVF